MKLLKFVDFDAMQNHRCDRRHNDQTLHFFKAFQLLIPTFSLTFLCIQSVPKFEFIFQNPFETYTLKPDAGTGVHKSAPILVPSTEDKRIVGCCCEYDYNEVVWFTLHKGKEQQCECGYYFKLMDHSPLDEGITPKFGKGFGSGMGKFK